MNIKYLHQPPKFIEIVDDYLKSYLSEHDISSRTRENYEGYRNRIEKFFDKTPVTEITAELMGVFRSKMRTPTAYKPALTQTTTSRTIEICKKAVKYALKRKLIQENLIQDIKTPRSKTKVIVTVSQNELELMWADASKDKEEEIAIDTYTLQVETGQSVGDLPYFRIKDNGELGVWLYNTRCKTKKHYGVPLTQTALNIISKYNGKMPILKNWNYNQALRRVAGRTITKYLTSHTARKTFATRMYEQGWSLESIADMMAISIHVLTTHYILKSMIRVENELRARLLA